MLKSKSVKPITYVGYTNNLQKRINLHNSGKGAKFTRGRKWTLIYKEKYKSKKEAISSRLCLRDRERIRQCYGKMHQEKCRCHRVKLP